MTNQAHCTCYAFSQVYHLAKLDIRTYCLNEHSHGIVCPRHLTEKLGMGDLLRQLVAQCKDLRPLGLLEEAS